MKLAIAAVVAIFVLVVWPTLELPWGACDDPHTFAIARRIDAEGPLMRIWAANRLGAESYAGRVMPLFWLFLWGTWKVLGSGVLWHRLLHVSAFAGLAAWVFGAVARAGATPARAALAAIGFLIFPAQYEVWPELQPVEGWQALAAALFVEALVRARHGTAALLLAVSLALKETSVCLGLPLAIATLCAGPERRRLWPVWAVYLAWFPLFLWGRPPASANAWVSNYQPTVATCLATLVGIGGCLWKTSALLVPAGLTGLARVAPEGRLRVGLAAAWAIGGILIFLPWSQLGPRHYTWFSAPLAVVVGAGAARAGRLVGVLVVASFLWMALQYAVISNMVLARYRWSDQPLWKLIDGVEPLAGRTGRLLRCGPSIAVPVADYLRECRGVNVTETKLAEAGPLRPGDVVVAAATSSEAALALVGPRADLLPVYTLDNRLVERDLPEPRYAFSLIRRALKGERGRDGSLFDLLVPVQWERRAGYAVMIPR